MQAVQHFTPDAACAYIAGIKWPSGPCCPKCGSVNVGSIPSRSRFQCREKGCRKQFSLTTGTILEATHLRADQWCIAVWQIINCRLGVSSCEIARTIGCKQQSAWHLLHRIRHVLAASHDEQFSGIVESDETFVGGLFKFMSAERRRRAQVRGREAKAVVHAVKERRSGKVRAEVIPAANTEYVRDAIMEHAAPGSELHTDESTIYNWAKGSYYKHRAVNHSRGKYVAKGNVHVNGCENFFNCLRRSVKGIYIKPTQEHLGAYVDEAVFRFNVRELSEWERFDKAMRLIVGKRLTYMALTDGAVR
ncbi:MAG: IS1595 family transposase [Phycisphaerales bacterium]